MSEEKSEKFTFEKLSGRENFSDWKFAMRMSLIHDDLRVCVDGYPDSDKRDENKRRKNYEKALAKISLAVKPCIFPRV